jgi:oxygen-independent coproporphyrinogen-3 oxidase
MTDNRTRRKASANSDSDAPAIRRVTAKWDNHCSVSLGIYISVPFCKTKCTYCNFASDVFSKAVFQKYVDRVCNDIESAQISCQRLGGRFEREVDSIYLGGGTPTILEIGEIERLFAAVSQNFHKAPGAEITVECAPGTLTSAMLDALQACGVNRVSLGVQSFIDEEAKAIGRLHRRETVLADIENLRAAGISDISIDLIAGLPHQTTKSWGESLDHVIASGVPHVSVYMLEVDEDSRLGRELIAGGTRYHAHLVPDEDLTAELYESAGERLEEAGLPQYEISNFARPGSRSRHNLKYWTRQPYLGFGVDAHSMLEAIDPELDAVRFATPDSLEKYVAGEALARTPVTPQNALEETFFLGLRLCDGVDLAEVSSKFGENAVAGLGPTLMELQSLGLVVQRENRIQLTRQGRLLSNEVFERFLNFEALQRAAL